MMIELPSLPYGAEALEPAISRRTLEIHHGRHHRGYVDKLNVLIKGSALDDAALETIVLRSSAGPIFNNAAQAWNHAFYWRSLTPEVRAGGPQGPLAARIAADFGTYERFCDLFKASAVALFGSGWAWFVEHGGKLEIKTTGNADTPIVRGQRPLLVLDVWEHAYYLDYQSRRIEYVERAVDSLLNWEFAQSNFTAQAVPA